MNEDEQSQSNKGEFFSMNLYQIDHMVKAGAGAEDVLAYLVLARGVNKRGGKNISTHGANSIATRTGMSHRRAEVALHWLAEQGYTKKQPEHQQGLSRMLKARRELAEAVDEKDIFLANTLTDGIGKGVNNPPLARIYNEVFMGQHGLMADARLDAVMVLLHLYRHHDLADCGGIDPRAGIYREWVAADNENGKRVTDLAGTNAALYEVKGSASSVFKSFAAEALFYVADPEERNIRFWDAFHSLHRLDFIYEALQVWSADPNGKDGRKAEPLYTLYVNDHHARRSDPYLQREIHTTAFNLDAMDTYTEFSGWKMDKAGFDSGSEFNNIIGTGRFRYIAPKKSCAYPIGIYRLKFRPKTRDNGIGIDTERKRVQEWAGLLKKLNPAPKSPPLPF